MADYDVRAFIEKRNAAMARNSSANQQAAQSMRAAGIANVGGKATTSSARDIQERFGRGLGSRSRKDPVTPDVEEDVGGVKSFMNSIFDWFNSSGASEPKMPPSYDGSSVYERSEFDIRPTPVTSSVLDAAPTGYDPYGIDTLNFGKGVDTNTDTAPETPESAKTDVFDPLNMKEKVQRDSETPGLMTPPSAEQPRVTGGKSLLTEAPETIRKTIESIMLTDPDVPYVIQAGDTLSEIAAKTGTTVNELQKLNKIKKANEIFAGDELIIPSAKSTKTKEDIVSSLIGDMDSGDYLKSRVGKGGSSFEGEGVETASSGEIVSDATLSEPTFELLKGVEGFKTEAYSLNNKITLGGKPHKSGLTVGAGIDFGQHTEQSLLDMGIPKSMVDKAKDKGWIGLNPDTIIDPKTNKPAATREIGHKLMYEKFEEQKKNKTLPVFTDTELNLSTPVVYKSYEDSAKRQYERDTGKSFNELSEGTKAVLTLEKYHRGKDYELPAEMIMNATIDSPTSTADGIKNNNRKKNMKDWLKKVGLNKGKGIQSSSRPPIRPENLMDKYIIPRPQPRPER